MRAACIANNRGAFFSRASEIALGPDVQQIDRLYSISSIDENYGGCSGDNSAPPRYDITLHGFDLQGGSASYPQRVCYYGDDKWDIRLDDTTDIDWDKNCGYDW